MQRKIFSLAVLAATVSAALAVVACQSAPKATVQVIEDKGTADGIKTPPWVTTYIESGVSAVQAMPLYKDKYCIIGEENGVNLSFVQAWADSFSAQQRIGAMLRTNIESKYQAAATGQASSVGGASSSSAADTNSGEYKQEIDNAINSVVNVSYSGAQREADWWRLTRRYDPDQKDVWTQQYTVYVLYTIPKAELNRQIASALETSVSKDSVLYDITIQIAKDLLVEGVNYLEPVTPGTASATSAVSAAPAAAPAANTVVPAAGTAKVTVLNKRGPSYFISTVNIFDGTATRGQPRINHTASIMADREAEWNLPEGPYTFVLYFNNEETEWAHATVAVTAGDSYKAEARDYWSFGFAKL